VTGNAESGVRAGGAGLDRRTSAAGPSAPDVTRSLDGLPGVVRRIAPRYGERGPSAAASGPRRHRHLRRGVPPWSPLVFVSPRYCEGSVTRSGPFAAVSGSLAGERSITRQIDTPAVLGLSASIIASIGAILWFMYTCVVTWSKRDRLTAGVT